KVLDAGTVGSRRSAVGSQEGESSSLLTAHCPAPADARPYFVMELVHGVSLTKYCDDNQLTPRQRLVLFVPVCLAIQHAHQKGIIHRDIKPSNVMITLYDGKPVPKVIDFGVAKATEQKLTERTLFTQYGTMVGTLEYMSPEQGHMEPAKLTKLVRGELDWIVMKTLEKDRNRRYETANAFADDVRRYLNDETVLACPPSAMYRFHKFARRRKAALTIAALIA